MYERVLSEYEPCIRSRQLVKEGQVRHYGRWVRSFLSFAASERIKDFETCLLRFLDDVEQRSTAPDWQIGQAKNAIHIYYYQFRPKQEERQTCEPLDAIDPLDFSQVREKAVAVLRLKNYAYRTEETYVGWMVSTVRQKSVTRRLPYSGCRSAPSGERVLQLENPDPEGAVRRRKRGSSGESKGWPPRLCSNTIQASFLLPRRSARQ